MSRTSPLGNARRSLQAAADQAEKWIEDHPGVALLAILIVYALAQLEYSLAAPLWHDELFTFYIAQAPSLHDLFRDIRHVDLNPPLSYLLTRLSFHLFGVGTLQCRLPEIAGFALAVVSVFAFVRRRAGASFGLCAACMLFASRAGELVTQARPYGLMLGTTALALACWAASRSERAARRRWTALAGLLVALTALLLTHVFGLLAWAALVIAEIIGSLRNRRIDRARLLALLLPLPATLSYRPLLSNHAQSAFPASFQPNGSDIFVFYMGHVDRELIILWLTAILLLALGGRAWLRPWGRFVLSFPEWVAVAGFLAAPLVLIGYLMLTHGAFFDRYGVIACLGTSILFAVLLQWWSGGRAAAALLAGVLALLITGRLPDAISSAVTGRIFHTTEPVAPPLPTALLRNPALPLVTASGLTFVEMQRRESPALLQHTFYLTDNDAALRYAHATIFEGIPEEASLFGFTAHVEAYKQFLAQHPVFYVLGTYDYPEDWLLRKLQHDGACLTVLGRVEGSYKDHELYEVHLTP